MRGFVFLLVMVTVAFPLDGQEYGEALYDALSWTNVGPARGGRSQAVAGSATRPLEYFFGAAGGGLWKTTDGGQTWKPVTDGLIGSSSIGAVAVCEADPDVVYIGTGETELRGNVQQGDGLYKSSDGGLTWAHIGLTEAQNFSRVRVHPTDCNIVWTAAFGKHSKANRERGIYKRVAAVAWHGPDRVTADHHGVGGKSWTSYRSVCRPSYRSVCLSCLSSC